MNLCKKTYKEDRDKLDSTKVDFYIIPASLKFEIDWPWFVLGHHQQDQVRKIEGNTCF
jgi:hypothetical protein